MSLTARAASRHLLAYSTGGDSSRAQAKAPRDADSQQASRSCVGSGRNLMLRMDEPETRRSQNPRMEQELESVAELYERYAPSVAKFFANRRFSPEDVQDLTQETFVSVLRRLSDLRDRDKFEAWLFKIAANKWRNACRDRATTRVYIQERTSTEQIADSDEGAVLRDENRNADPLRIALVGEEHRLLREALATLSPPLLSATLLRLDQELSYEQIAAVLKIPVGTVKSRLNKATRLLQRALGDTFGEVIL